MWVISSNYCLLLKKLNRQIWCVTGLLPWNAVPGKACGMTLSAVCKTREVKTQEEEEEMSVLNKWGLHIVTVLLPSVPDDLQPLRRGLRRRRHHCFGTGEWSYLWVVIQRVWGSCDAVPLWVEALKHPRLPTADWQTVCSLFRCLWLPQNQYNTAAMCRQGLGGRSPLPQNRFRLCSVPSAHLSFLSCNGLSLFFILSSPVFLHFLSLLVPP